MVRRSKIKLSDDVKLAKNEKWQFLFIPFVSGMKIKKNMWHHQPPNGHRQKHYFTTIVSLVGGYLAQNFCKWYDMFDLNYHWIILKW